MSNALQPKPLYEVGPKFAEDLGLDWCRDRHEVLDKLNQVREMLYIDPDMPRLFDNKFYCIETECFPEDCLCTCACGGATYWGITIPDDIDGILEVWDDHLPLRNYSKHWEGRYYRVTKDMGPCHSTVLMHETFPTRRPMKEISKLSVLNENSQDEGKIVIIKVDTGDCVDKEIHFTLGDCQIIESDHYVKAVKQVILPQDLLGCVTLFAGDEELSVYSPHNTVPCFRRLKITTPCGTNKVLLHGSARFSNICFDSDIVEVGSRLILRKFADYFKYADIGTESDEIARGRIALNDAKRLIKGAIERHRGKSKQDPSQFTRRRLYASPSLYRRRTR